MTRRVILRERAILDLEELGAWLIEESDREVALAYVRRVRRRCDDLADFPHRGSPRPRLGHSVRSLSFERRIVILYRVTSVQVEVLRVVNGARDLDPLELD